MPAFPFLKLPAELRLRVYRYLLHALYDICIDSSEAAKESFGPRFPGDDVGETGETYRDMYRVTATGLHPAILSVNRQTYLEATGVLYSENRFNFCAKENLTSFAAIAAVIPFFEDLSEGSRRLIREIKYLYIDTRFMLVSFWSIPSQPFHDRVFSETCTYLSQNLQLQQVTLRIVGPGTLLVRFRSSADYRMYLANLDTHDWIQCLVPLAKNLETFALIRGKDEDAGLAHAAHRYLNSKMAEASNTACQIQITQLGPGSTA